MIDVMQILAMLQPHESIEFTRPDAFCFEVTMRTTENHKHWRSDFHITQHECDAAKFPVLMYKIKQLIEHHRDVVVNS
jgi:hypothetical protein